MRIGIIGLGYVGITSLAAFARNRHSVVGYEVNQTKLELLEAGSTPISEPSVSDILRVNKDKISYRGDIDGSVNDLDCVLVCVGTPTDGNGITDLSAINAVVRELSCVCTSGVPIFIRSTCPIGTTRSLGTAYPSLNLSFHPEFLREGTAIDDFFNPPKIVLGIVDSGNLEAENILKGLYSGIEAERFLVSYEAAESVKYVDNMFHALKVVFTNEVSKVIANKNADPSVVMNIFRSDKQLNISGAYLTPGFAYGGSCLEKDLYSFRRQGKAHNLPLLNAITTSNEAAIQDFYEKITATGAIFILNGLSFKDATDDLRRSPFVTLAKKLLADGHDVICFDSNLTTCFGESLSILNELHQFERFSLNQGTAPSNTDSVLIRCHERSHYELDIKFKASYDLFFGGDILGTLR